MASKVLDGLVGQVNEMRSSVEWAVERLQALQGQGYSPEYVERELADVVFVLQASLPGERDEDE